ADATHDERGPLLDWMLDNMALPLDLDTLPKHAHMSRQTLTRRFREETGVAPMAWLADARIDRARELLETTGEPIENIGRLTGLGAPASVRAAFHRRIGTSPKEYRAVWRGSSTSATATVRASPPGHEAAERHRSPAPTQGEEPLRDPARLSAWTRVPGSLAKP